MSEEWRNPKATRRVAQRRRGIPARLVAGPLVAGALAVGVLAAGLLTASPAAAIGRCDVHPIGRPDGVVAPDDALVILRVAVRLLDASAVTLERADLAPPAKPIVAGVLIPGGDGVVFAEDALLCLRVAVGLLSIPANLIASIESISPARPVVGSTGTARVRIENDGDSAAAGTTVSLRRGSPFPGPADAFVSVARALPPGDSEFIDVVFPAGGVAGNTQLFALVETTGAEMGLEDNIDSFAFEINGPPVADAGADLLGVLEQTTVVLDGSGSSDPNDVFSSLTFAWTPVPGGPEVVLVGADSVNPTFAAPDISRETELRFSLRVRDPDALESEPPATVAVQIVPLNDPPIANAGLDQSGVEELTVLTLMGTASDPNGDPVTTLWVQTSGPAAVIESPTELTTGLTLPDIAEPQFLLFELRVTDDEGATAADSVQVAAVALNSRPIASVTIFPSDSVLEATLVTLDGTGSSDPDGDSLSFAWRKIEGSDVVLSDDGMGTATFAAPEAPTPEQMRFELLVEDGLGGSDRREVQLEIRPDSLHPMLVIVRVTPPTALVQAPGSSDPAMTVEVEVVPRDPLRLVPDGTPVELSASPLGVLEEVSGVTQLGLFTTILTPESNAGVTVVRAAVPGTSAAGEARASFHDSPDEVGRLSLSLDPSTVVVGSGESVQVVAVAYPADERIGAVADGTILEFSASAGSFPSGRSAVTLSGVATISFEPPAEHGSIEITATAGAEASARLSVLSDSEAVGTVRLEADALTVVAGGPGTTVSAFIEPALRGGAVDSAIQVGFSAEVGMFAGGDSPVSAGAFAAVVTSDALLEEFDRPPLGDFPGADDFDADADGTLDVPGERVARVTFRHPGPVSEPILADIGAAIVGVPGLVDAIRITVVPVPADPGSVALTSDSPVVVAGGAGATLTARVDSAGGGPVADGTPIGFAASRGRLVPPSTTTAGGGGSSGLSHSKSFDLTARMRAKVQVGTVEDFLDLILAPDGESPGSIVLTLTSTVIPNDGESELLVSAHVRKADGNDADDGTRVLFDFSSGTPSMAFAETVDGVAEITLGAAAEPGPLEVGARVAGSVVARSARAAFAPPRFLTATFNLVNAVGVGALSIDVPFPAGAAPIEGEDGVVLDLLLGTNAPPDEGIANAATLVIGNRVEGVNIVSVGVITLQPIDGSGAFFRMSFELPPGAEFDCDSLQPVFFRASDGISQIPGVDFVCDHVTRSARGQPNRE